MKTLARILAALALLLPIAVEAAEEWGIKHEKTTRFEAKVVDILCELTGDCPANCGDGKRQLGLLRHDGRLILAVKNFDIFAGTVNDLAPYCNKNITADGLFIDNPKLPMFVLQFKRLAPDGKWNRANWYIRDWAKANNVKRTSDTAQAWYNNDKRVKQTIKRDGVYGIPGLKPPAE